MVAGLDVIDSIGCTIVVHEIQAPLHLPLNSEDQVYPSVSLPSYCGPDLPSRVRQRLSCRNYEDNVRWRQFSKPQS